MMQSNAYTMHLRFARFGHLRRSGPWSLSTVRSCDWNKCRHRNIKGRCCGVQIECSGASILDQNERRNRTRQCRFIRDLGRWSRRNVWRTHLGHSSNRGRNVLLSVRVSCGHGWENYCWFKYRYSSVLRVGSGTNIAISIKNVCWPHKRYGTNIIYKFLSGWGLGRLVRMVRMFCKLRECYARKNKIM